jgi:hypothetical protein
MHDVVVGEARVHFEAGINSIDATPAPGSKGAGSASAHAS